MWIEDREHFFLRIAALLLSWSSSGYTSSLKLTADRSDYFKPTLDTDRNRTVKYLQYQRECGSLPSWHAPVW